MANADSLRRRANSRNVSFRISLRWPIHIINSVDKTKLSCNTPHRRSTTVSLETVPPLFICICRLKNGLVSFLSLVLQYRVAFMSSDIPSSTVLVSLICWHLDYCWSITSDFCWVNHWWIAAVELVAFYPQLSRESIRPSSVYGSDCFDHYLVMFIPPQIMGSMARLHYPEIHKHILLATLNNDFSFINSVICLLIFFFQHSFFLLYYTKLLTIYTSFITTLY